MALTEEDRGELLPSGKQAIFDNRLGWAKTYLDKAGLLATVKRGIYRITNDGQRLLAQKPQRVDKQMLLQFDMFRTFIQQRHDDHSAERVPALGTARFGERRPRIWFM